MIAYKIDVINQNVTPIEYNGYTDICPNLSTPHKAVSLFTTVYMSTEGHYSRSGDCIYVDDEGLLVGTNFGFKYKGYNGVLMGNGLVLGTDENGDSTAPDIDIYTLRENITFLGLVKIHEGYHGFTVMPLEGGLA